MVAVFDRGSGAVSPESVEAMCDRIDHRGPDGSGVWIDDAVGLGHLHLATTPQASHDDQPHAEGDLVVAGDVRLDNRPELFEALSVDGDPARVPDSHLLLAAYREWGERCVEHLIGAFAFVLWDAERERLFCGRDHFGVKPLYVYRTDGAFAVASEEKALLELPAVAPRLDESKVGDFLLGQFEDERNTYFEPVRRLPPAHAATIRADGASEWQYWTLDPTRTVDLPSDEAYVRRFRELFELAVARRLRTADDVGTTLSGGLDSSSVTGVARQELPADRTLRTFSGVFPETEVCDEREYVEAVVDREGIEPHYVDVDALSPIGHVDRALDHYDQPVYNTMDYMNWALAERAADEGVGVVLKGTHGDSAVDYGLGLLPQLFRTGRWLHLGRELRAMGDVLGRSPKDLFAERVLGQLVPEPVERVLRRVRGQPSEFEEANPTLAPAFVERTDLRTRYRELQPRGSALRRSARRWQHRSLLTGDMTEFLETNDRTYAALGLEPRYPFVDPRFVEFSLATPPSLKLRDGWTRWIVRRALDDVLPDSVQWRPWKTTLNAGFHAGLRADAETLRASVLETDVLDPFLDADDLADTYDRFRDDPHPTDVKVLWRAHTLARWLETTPARRDGAESARDAGSARS